jgi:hypothetical protein
MSGDRMLFHNIVTKIFPKEIVKLSGKIVEKIHKVITRMLR